MGTWGNVLAMFKALSLLKTTWWGQSNLQLINCLVYVSSPCFECWGRPCIKIDLEL